MRCWIEISPLLAARASLSEIVAGCVWDGSREHCMQYILSYFWMIEPLQYAHLREIGFVIKLSVRAKPVFTAASRYRQQDVIFWSQIVL